MNVVHHLIEPDRLNLVWQAPEGLSRTRRRVAELLRMNGETSLRYLPETEDYQDAILNGFVGFPAFKPQKIEHKQGVVEIFMRRLPPRSRSDFNDYLTRLALPPNAEISDFSLLGYSEAKLPGDGFSIVNDFQDIDGPCEFLTEIAGFRYYPGMNLEIGEVIGLTVGFESEPENQIDRNAVRVVAEGLKLGYVNRIQAQAFRRWIASNQVEAAIERINGTRERPRVHLFVKVRPSSLTWLS